MLVNSYLHTITTGNREGNFYFPGTTLKRFGHCFVIDLCQLVSVAKRTLISYNKCNREEGSYF